MGSAGIIPPNIGINSAWPPRHFAVEATTHGQATVCPKAIAHGTMATLLWPAIAASGLEHTTVIAASARHETAAVVRCLWHQLLLAYGLIPHDHTPNYPAERWGIQCVFSLQTSHDHVYQYIL